MNRRPGPPLETPVGFLFPGFPESCEVWEGSEGSDCSIAANDETVSAASIAPTVSKVPNVSEEETELIVSEISVA